LGKRYRLNIKVSAEDLKPKPAPVIPINETLSLLRQSCNLQRRGCAGVLNNRNRMIPNYFDEDHTVQMWNRTGKNGGLRFFRFSMKTQYPQDIRCHLPKGQPILLPDFLIGIGTVAAFGE